MKKLLFLGGGFLQNFVILRAKQLGYYVYVLDANPNAIGFKIADEYAVINIVDEKACLEYAKSHQIDGVLTAATDFSILSMSRIASELGVPGINYESAKIIKNKAAVRKILFDTHADDTGYSYEIHNINDAEKLKDSIVYPVMVKPCDGSGSRGTSRVDNAEDFVEACEFAMDGSITQRAVVEPFVIGREYGVESFVENENIYVLGVMQKDMTNPPYYAELGHAIPSGLSEEMEIKVKICVRNALIALGVNHGSVNMDIIIGEKGDIHIVDVGARMGGNLIGSHIVPIGIGVDYMGNMIRAAVGDKTDWTTICDPKPVATKLLALTPGDVVGLPDFDKIANENAVVIEHHLNLGDKINEYHTNLDGCGYVVAVDSNVNDAIKKAQQVRSIIDNSIERS